MKSKVRIKTHVFWFIIGWTLLHSTSYVKVLVFRTHSSPLVGRWACAHSLSSYWAPTIHNAPWQYPYPAFSEVYTIPQSLITGNEDCYRFECLYFWYSTLSEYNRIYKNEDTTLRTHSNYIYHKNFIHSFIHPLTHSQYCSLCFLFFFN